MPVNIVFADAVFDIDFEDDFEEYSEEDFEDHSEEDFMEEPIIQVPLNLNDPSDFPPLSSDTTIDGWDCIDTQETEDVLVTQDMEDWEQLELAIKQSENFEYCFAAVAKQTQHVPSPVPHLVAPTVPRDIPLMRRVKQHRQEENYIDDDQDDSLWDLYPVSKSPKRFHKSQNIQRQQLLHCFNTIPTATPEEPVVTDPRLHKKCAYSEPLTDHQYRHAIFKLVQLDRRWLAWEGLYYQPGLTDFLRDLDLSQRNKEAEGLSQP
ncbi:hypothetical protein BGW37DRAFT_503517 [Umbelopsis sp. PMI_123]|nr:hypothetical protein BGW37DRAFT_503517 [Umbelopsis sp. PMI_123]